MAVAVVPVVVPEGASPGSVISARLPSGTNVTVTVPENAVPGGMLYIEDRNFHPCSSAWHQGYPNAPEGKWSAGLFDIFSHLPSCCMSSFCVFVPVGQVAQKLRLFKHAFYIITILGVAHIFQQLGVYEPESDAAVIIVFMVNLLYSVTLFIVIMWARNRTATLYRIPIGACSNCLASFFCPCCSILQVARHLFNWNTGMRGGCECSAEPEGSWPPPTSSTLAVPSEQDDFSSSHPALATTAAIVNISGPPPYAPPHRSGGTTSEEMYYDEEAAPSAPLLGTLVEEDS
jgi:Cys-rich protein (TIGR01571 family)